MFGRRALPLVTPMYGPAVRCKSFEFIRQVRSCINVSGLCLERGVLRAIMGISAPAISLPDRPRTGHLGHQCSYAPGRPILHRRLILSQTSAGKLSYVIDSSSSCLALFLCLCLVAVPSSRPARAERAARRGPSRLAVAQASPLASMLPRPRLVRSRARREDYAGRDAIASVLTHVKVRPLWRTAHAMRASLLASAMASTLWCSRFFAASIQDLSP